MRRKLLGFSIGLAIAAVGITLLRIFPAQEVAVQVAVWSVTVLVIVIGANYKHFGEEWVWKACLVVIALHAVFVATLRHSLPFSTLGVPILMSFPESIVLLFIFAMMRDGSRIK